MSDEPVIATERPSLLRRFRFPAILFGLLGLAWLAMAGMERFDIGMEYFFSAMMGFQFLFMFTILATCVWFLFASGFSWKVRVFVSLFVATGLIAFIMMVQKMEFDGQMTPRVHWVWEPNDEQRLASIRSAPTVGGTDLTQGPLDSPQYRGINGDGAMPVRINVEKPVSDWPIRWQHAVGGGHAGIAVVGNSAITLEQDGDREHVVCYDRDNGNKRWDYAYAALFNQTEPMGGVGPRSTPTIRDSEVYTLGGTGLLHCLDGRTGTLRWQVNVISDTGSAVPEWGVTASPVVTDKLVIVNAGVNPKDNKKQALAAYDRKNGTRVWANGSAPAAYASPRLVTLLGVPQVLTFDGVGLGGYDPESGAELWRYPWKTDMLMNSAQPVIVGNDRIFVSSEKSNGGAMLSMKIEGNEWKLSEQWKTRALSARFSNPVILKDHLYGLSGGSLVCVDASTGQRLWSEGNYGNGQVILAGEHLVITSEKGEVSVANASPAGYESHGRLKVLADRTWNVPTLAGGQLFVRNHREMAMIEVPIVR